jgi:hypothetical protein
MGIMRVLDETGDTVVAWSLDDPASVTAAEEEFRRQLAGAVPVARAAGAPGSAARIVTRFDPSAEEIIWTRPVVGG